MAELAAYSPEEVVVLLAGIYPVEGYVDGTFISINKDALPYTTITTADGQMARLYRSSQSYTITLTVHSGSSANDFLTKLWQLDELTQRAKFPLFIKDGTGSDLFFSLTTWIENPASIVKSQGYDARQWVLRSSQATVNIGSNANAASILGDLVNIATGALPAIGGLI